MTPDTGAIRMCSTIGFYGSSATSASLHRRAFSYYRRLLRPLLGPTGSDVLVLSVTQRAGLGLALLCSPGIWTMTLMAEDNVAYLAPAGFLHLVTSDCETPR